MQVGTLFRLVCVLASLAPQSLAHLERGALAVVMPLTVELLPRLPRTFEFWRRHPPCSNPMQQRVAFIFQFNRVLTPASTNDLEAVWASSGGARCFSEVLFLSLNQTDAQEANVIEASCHQHYRTYTQVLKTGYSHWLQYETDVLPVRTGWLERVVDEATRNGDCERWWVQGASWGYIPAPVTRHRRVDGIMLNGNALYCVNKEVLTYIDDVVAQFAPIGCHDDPARTTSNWLRQRLKARALPGFDTVQYWYRTSVRNRDKLQARAHLFVAVDWIADLNRVEPATVRQLVQSRPSLVLVHTKSFFNDSRSSWEIGLRSAQGQHARSGFAAVACWLLACICVIKPFRSRSALSSALGRAQPRAGSEASIKHLTFL